MAKSRNLLPRALHRSELLDPQAGWMRADTVPGERCVSLYLSSEAWARKRERSHVARLRKLIREAEARLRELNEGSPGSETTFPFLSDLEHWAERGVWIPKAAGTVVFLASERRMGWIWVPEVLQMESCVESWVEVGESFHLAPLFSQPTAELRKRPNWEELKGRRDYVSDLKRILRHAALGSVRRLWIAKEAVLGSHHAQAVVLDDLAERVAARGGKVEVVPFSELPSSAPAVALVAGKAPLRFKYA